MKFEKRVQKKLNAITKDYSKELNFSVRNLNEEKLRDIVDINDIEIMAEFKKKQGTKLTKKYGEIYRLSESEENVLNKILKYRFVYWEARGCNEIVYLGSSGSLNEYENMVSSTFFKQKSNISYNGIRKETLFSLSKKMDIEVANKLVISESFGDVIDFELDEIVDAIFIKIFRLEYDHLLNTFRMKGCLE